MEASAAKSVLLDYVVLREVLRGRFPAVLGRLDQVTNLNVTYTEYLILLRTITDRPASTLFRAIQQISGHDGRFLEAAALLDLGAVRDTRGISINLVIPRPEAATRVVEHMANYSLLENEASNLVFAESENSVFCASRSAVRADMEHALVHRSVSYSFID